ncbi:hypothetical protein [Pelagibius sp.]|uniref:hypothetical protein n=1 Tax=Pelagibius sp. TaxID=1931238 RepID=UPI003BAFD0A5
MILLLPRLMTAALILTVFAATAQAQSDTPAPAGPSGGPLAGVSVLQLVVAPLSADSATCGLEAGLVEESFQQPLKLENIGLQKSAHVRIIVKATSVVYQDNVCISNIEAVAVQNTRYFDRKTETERAGQVLLWSESGLFVTDQRDHVVLTNIGFRDLARSFIRKWKIDQ